MDVGHLQLIFNVIAITGISSLAWFVAISSNGRTKRCCGGPEAQFRVGRQPCQLDAGRTCAEEHPAGAGDGYSPIS